MEPYEDFEFSSPLTVSEALDRLKKHGSNPGDGTFYGEVNGNYFNLTHDAGKGKVNPQLSGYVVPEVVGCQVFARTHIIGRIDSFTYAFVLSIGSLIYGMIRHSWFAKKVFVFMKAHWLPVLFGTALFCTAVLIAAWYLQKKFRERGRFKVISKFYGCRI